MIQDFGPLIPNIFRKIFFATGKLDEFPITSLKNHDPGFTAKKVN